MIIIKLNIVFLKNNMYFYLSNVCFLWCLKCTSSTNKIKMTKKWFLICFLLKEKETKKKETSKVLETFFLAIELLHLPIHWKGLNLSASTRYSLAVFLAHLQPISITLFGKQVLSTPSRWFYSQENVEFSVLFLHGWLTFAYYLSCVWK